MDRFIESNDDLQIDDLEEENFPGWQKLKKMWGDEITQLLKKYGRGNCEPEDINRLLELNQVAKVAEHMDNWISVLDYTWTSSAWDNVMNYLDFYDKKDIIEMDKKDFRYQGWEEEQILNTKLSILKRMETNKLPNINLDKIEEPEVKIEIIKRSTPAFAEEILQSGGEDIENNPEVLAAILSKIENKDVLWKTIQNSVNPIEIQSAKARLRELGYRGPFPEQLNLF